MRVDSIFGPPGCGKTQTLIETAVEEANRVPRVLFLSFTKAAAQEAASRVHSPTVTASTIHSFAFKSLGLQSSQVVDSTKLQSSASEVGIPLKTRDEDDLQVGDEYLQVIGYARNKLLTMPDAYDEFGRPGTPKDFRMFATAYEEWKKLYGYMDFDDMIEDLMKTDAYVPPVVILDEAQDCSPLQWQVMEWLSFRTKHIYLAGDDDQAILEWSGADPHGMVKLADAHGAQVRVLEQSYRMPPSVHAFVHDRLLSQFDRRQTKVFRPRETGGGVDSGVLRFGSFADVDPTGIGTTNCLILLRDRFRMLDARKVLNAYQIPYYIQGGSSPWDNTKANAIRGMRRMNMGEVATHKELRALTLALNDSAIMKGDYSKIMGKNWRTAIPLTETQLDFYESVDLDAPINTTLSTIHQAKGREADRVIVDLVLTPRVVDNYGRNPDAELRVMYVACTRARESLHLCAEIRSYETRLR